MWNKEKIKKHIKVAKLLDKIKNEAFDLIKQEKNISEYEVQQFILKKYKEYKLKSDIIGAIVAFRENTSYVHYFPSQYCHKSKLGDLILIDMWARLNQPNAPFADITWMGYLGKKIPDEKNKIFNIVKDARDKAVDYLKKNLKKGKIPTGQEIDMIAREYIKQKGLGKKFLHTTGHSVGFSGAHGIHGGLSVKNKNKLFKNLGYTIEPGIYLKNKFGVRSEIDFYITEDLKLKITTEQQKQITIL